MTTLITKFKSTLSKAVLFAAGIFMLGLGFALVGTVALFGLMAVGVALVAGLFVAPALPATDDAEQTL